MNIKKEQRKLKMKIDPANEGGTYSNIVTVLSSETEFLLDFGMFLPGSDQIKVGSRIIMNPRTAKQLLAAITNNIRNYESKHGEIKLPQAQLNLNKGPDLVQ